jgi:hypothetical protein
LGPSPSRRTYSPPRFSRWEVPRWP